MALLLRCAPRAGRAGGLERDLRDDQIALLVLSGVHDDTRALLDLGVIDLLAVTEPHLERAVLLGVEGEDFVLLVDRGDGENGGLDLLGRLGLLLFVLVLLLVIVVVFLFLVFLVVVGLVLVLVFIFLVGLVLFLLVLFLLVLVLLRLLGLRLAATGLGGRARLGSLVLVVVIVVVFEEIECLELLDLPFQLRENESLHAVALEDVFVKGFQQGCGLPLRDRLVGEHLDLVIPPVVQPLDADLLAEDAVLFLGLVRDVLDGAVIHREQLDL